MKVYCLFSLESPHPGDSNEYTQYTIFNMKKNTLNDPTSAAMDFFSRGLKNKFETAMVNKLSVFKSLNFYCIMKIYTCQTRMSWIPLAIFSDILPKVSYLFVQYIANIKPRQNIRDFYIHFIYSIKKQGN